MPTRDEIRQLDIAKVLRESGCTTTDGTRVVAPMGQVIAALVGASTVETALGPAVSTAPADILVVDAENIKNDPNTTIIHIPWWKRYWWYMTTGQPWSGSNGQT